MTNLKIIIITISSIILLVVLNLIAAKLIRSRNKRKKAINIVPAEPSIFEKITLQFSDKISKELEAAEKKIRSVVGSEENDTKDREHGMFL